MTRNLTDSAGGFGPAPPMILVEHCCDDTLSPVTVFECGMESHSVLYSTSSQDGGGCDLLQPQFRSLLRIPGKAYGPAKQSSIVWRCAMESNPPCVCA